MTIGRRLAKLEKLVGTREVHCRACRFVTPLILVPPADTPNGRAPATEADHFARCETCGKVQRRQVILLEFAGSPEPTVPWR